MAVESTLAALRRRLNLTQEEFAVKVGRSQTEVSRWENLRRVPYDLLPTILAEFNRLLPIDVMEGITTLDLLKPWSEIVARRAVKEERRSGTR